MGYTAGTCNSGSMQVTGLTRPLPATCALLCLCLQLLWSPTAAAQKIYRVVTEDGVIFTDQPPENVAPENIEEVELQELNTAPPPQPLPAMEPAEPADTPAAPPPAVRITAPPDESTIAMGPGDFAVRASAQPPLRRGETLRLLIDGQPWGDPQPGGSWQVRGALRGPHDLVVERRLREQVIARSDAVRVYVLRPSVLNR